MKKTYIEPVMIVEDFTVSEMVAKNCKYTPTTIALVQQMTNFKPACGSGYYPDDPVKGNDYAMFSDLYEAEYDLDGDNNLYEETEACFTVAFRQEGIKNSRGGLACTFDPFEANISFGHGIQGYDCKSDDNDAELLQNS